MVAAPYRRAAVANPGRTQVPSPDAASRCPEAPSTEELERHVPFIAQDRPHGARKPLSRSSGACRVLRTVVRERGFTLAQIEEVKDEAGTVSGY